MQLRLAGLFQREGVALSIGVLLCFLALVVVGTAAVLADNDRCAEVAAEIQEHEQAPESSLPDETTTRVEVYEEHDRVREDKAFEAGSPQPLVGPSSPDHGSEAEHEEGNSPPSEGPSEWLARVVGGSLCIDETRQEAAL